jgi:hypothetical protein
MFGSRGYNYEQFNRKSLLSDAVISKFGGAPKSGDKAPDFEGRTLEGDKVRLSDFSGEKNVVVTFGSATCPQSAGSIGGLNDLYEDYRDENTEFLYVYVREAHPGEEIPAHRSMNDKIAAAERFMAHYRTPPSSSTRADGWRSGRWRRVLRRLPPHWMNCSKFRKNAVQTTRSFRAARKRGCHPCTRW